MRILRFKRLFLAVLLFTVTVLGFFYVINDSIKPVSNDGSLLKFTIKKGQSASQIASGLKDRGLVKSALVFKFYIQATGNASKIQAGQYSLSKNLSLVEIINKLLKGPDLVWVTVPEGLRREQIAKRLVDQLEVQDQDIYINEFLSFSENFEGYLFPDTYLVAKDIAPGIFYKIMRDTFNAKTSPLKNNSNLDFSKAVVLASLIERETKTSEEKPLVAGVILNRLQADWPLQIDAAVQYAIAQRNCRGNVYCQEFWPQITKSDLSIESLFNTYKYTGLPPAPICNPGLDSLSAALNPKNSDYWFYIHDNQGQIHFAKTLEEHNGNVREYLKK